MNDQLLRTFIALVTFDQKINSLIEERKILISERSALDVQKTALADGLNALMSKLYDLKKDVDEKELFMKVLDQQEAEKKGRLENAATPKEYASLKLELAAINEKQREHESLLIDSWDKLDASKKKYQSEQVSCQNIIKEIDQKVLEFDKKVEDLAIQIHEHEKDRINFVRVVPTELLDNYEHMRGQVVNPVVPVVQNSCSTCYYPVPAQDLAALRKGKFLPCKGCYRILYIEDSSQ